MINKLLCAIAIVSLATLAGRAQERPKFAGKWVLVADKSVPATAPHQADITISQGDATFSLTRKAVRSTAQDGLLVQSGKPGDPATIKREEVEYELAYVVDSADHDSPLPPAPPNAMRATTQSKYRAIWTQNQLIIITNEVRQPDRNSFSPRRVNRLAFSLDADGLLTIESVSILDPSPGGPSQPAPTLTRSVYKKSS